MIPAGGIPNDQAFNLHSGRSTPDQSDRVVGAQMCD
jgi:hypothetical protein